MVDVLVCGVTMATRTEVTLLGSRMSMEDLKKLQNLFFVYPSVSRSLSKSEFIHLACSSVGRGSKEEYGLMFDSAVASEGHLGLFPHSNAVKEEAQVDWGALCSFLLEELSERLKHNRVKCVHCWKPPRCLTCPHRDPIQKVLYLPSWGQYMTVSKGGSVGMRDCSDLSLVSTLRLQNSTVRPRDMWVTDVALLQNLHKIAVSFTSNEVGFYDIAFKKDISCKYKVQGLTFTPWCLDYWADPSKPDDAILAIGDIGGQVSALCFTSAQLFLFERRSQWTDSDSAIIIQWDDVIKGKHHCCYILQHHAHKPAWVRKVLYLDSLDAFVSCSTKPKSSMVIGWRQKNNKSLRVTSFLTRSGVWDIDHHHELKIIATAGADHQILLWNSFVTSQPVYALNGHIAPVTAVRFLQKKNQLLSYSKDKALYLWDVSSQLCIHRLGGVFPATQGDTHTHLLLIEERQLLLLTFNSLLVLLENTKEEARTSSHEHPVTCVLYNSLFRHVISSDTGSSVICWMADTGQKVKQIHRCHGNAEISTMALNETQNRLFTAGTDGEVKVWDFNGRCLHRMSVALGKAVAITHILLLRTGLLVMGWERMLTVFRRNSFTKSDVEPSEWKGAVHHRTDVLCAAFQPPQTLVTGSRDGEIIVWNNNTEKALRKLQLPAKHEEFKRTEHSLDAITKLLFLQGRTSAQIATGGTDLLSCGNSGMVRLWNAVYGRLLGQFMAHDPQLGSIVMTVCPYGKLLVTADRRGTVKTWDIEHYCLESNEKVVTEPPELVHSFHPHMNGVTHLDTIILGDQQLLLSASLDCSVALSYLPGETIGLFGQGEQWSIVRPGCVHSQRDIYDDRHPDNTIINHIIRRRLRSSPRGVMNLNDFVMLPKTKSSLFSSRNTQSLHLETASLTQQSNELEEKLRKLKESMRKEKGERGHSGFFHQKPEQCGSINRSSLTQSALKTQKQLSAGKMKIRFLKDEPLTAPPHLPLCETCCCPQSPKQSRMKATNCGQGDNRNDQKMFIGNYGEKTRVEMTGKEHNENGRKAFKNSLLSGGYDEEKSARSFQQALKDWRNRKCDIATEPVTISTQTVSGIAAQADFPRGRCHEANPERWEDSKVPVKVEFPESRLTYMDRLLLKKHRRFTGFQSLSKLPSGIRRTTP
ncbi:WD repeat-containing protein on Y chromosome [Corythoichthys intestinalis]|uniref:WD repeat-containing protein on Y chromosome n=1 Tax=Corythoichthys intestinalis TaxID=161448 RepID=UPI0025A50015|nr:WD repeat-containing protein on Y chromosome [Corythoichthys intestinalis]